MKTMIKKLAIPAVVSILALSGCASEGVVTERPAPPVIITPGPPPYPGAVWIGDEWRWRGGGYHYITPHYVRPRAARVYTPGQWRSTPRGHVWVRGSWRR